MLHSSVGWKVSSGSVWKTDGKLIWGTTDPTDLGDV